MIAYVVALFLASVRSCLRKEVFLKCMGFVVFL